MSKLSRREFLENSMLAAAAAAASGAVTSPTVYGQQASSSPNERLRVAVLGVRSRGQSHLSAFMRRQDTEVVAIVDPDEEIGRTKGVDVVEKATGKKPALFADLRKVMDDTSIDIVSIATPNHWHSLAAIWAIQSGKDVYVEKPVSHNVSEGRRVVQAARKYNKICQTGTQVRSTSGTQEAIAFLKSGELGECKLARGLCYKPRGSIGPKGTYEIPASVNYDLWLGPAPEAALTRPKLHYDWHWQWAYGNGDLGNQGIHQMDVCRWGLGVNSVGESVLSYGARFGYVDAGETANTQVNIHNYGDKTLVFEVRGLNTDALRGAKIGCIFYGSKGYLVLNNYNGGAAFDLDGNQIKTFNGGEDHFGNFLTAVRSRKVSDLTADIEEGHLSSALCHLGNISMRLGEQVSAKQAEQKLEGNKEALETFERFSKHLADNKVDLANTPFQFGPQLTLNGETFSGPMSEQANPMLTREYRKPFVVPEESAI